MTPSKEKYDESKPGPRLIVLMGLLITGSDTGLLSIDALRTSPVSMIYAVALATAVVATLLALRRGAQEDTSPEAEAPRTGPVWHESTLFTDPWYQVPAIFCVFILFSKFVLDLVAEPPRTDQAVWFLAGLGIATLATAFGLIGPTASKKRPKDEPTNPAGEAAISGEEESAVGAALRDPWFSVPAGSIGLLHVAQAGLERIEEDPRSLGATVWLLMPAVGLLAGLVSTAISRTRQKRKEAAVVVNAEAVTATTEDAGGDAGAPSV
ncbi:MAG: hypothetical protein F4112_07380 [Holophagales bacterium]|nr:hypothetical protein [Holophagales bacterium]MYD21185.1 hypothetical protein [Holophagales bacterium]MYI32774.1 hypothetical protein [Holophagales bacterium]